MNLNIYENLRIVQQKQAGNTDSGLSFEHQRILSGCGTRCGLGDSAIDQRRGWFGCALEGAGCVSEIPAVPRRGWLIGTV